MKWQTVAVAAAAVLVALMIDAKTGISGTVSSQLARVV